jgi:hypothetical protein
VAVADGAGAAVPAPESTSIGAAPPSVAAAGVALVVPGAVGEGPGNRMRFIAGTPAVVPATASAPVATVILVSPAASVVAALANALGAADDAAAPGAAAAASPPPALAFRLAKMYWTYASSGLATGAAAVPAAVPAAAAVPVAAAAASGAGAGAFFLKETPPPSISLAVLRVCLTSSANKI